MKTTEMDVKKDVLQQLIDLMEGKMLSSMKSKPEEEEEEEDEPKVKGLSISVIKPGIETEEEDEDEDSIQSKLKKLFAKE